MSHKNIWEESGVLVELSGILTNQDIFDSNMEIYGNDNFDHCQYQLVDAREIDGVDIDGDSIELLSVMDKTAISYKQYMRVALVGTNPQFIEFFSEYVNELDGSDWVAKIFDNLAEARAWVES